MDPVENPYAPGAGSPPPELAGRDDLRETSRVALARVRRGLPTKNILVAGLRGVGKTVLLGRLCDEAEASAVCTIRVDTPGERSLPALLVPQLRRSLLRLTQVAKARDSAHRALRSLAGFVKATRLRYPDLDSEVDETPDPGVADSGDLEHDLQTVVEAAGGAASAADTALALFIDELQYVGEEELAALISAMHRTAQRGLPVVLVGAGLPQLQVRAERAKSYAERLFDLAEVGPLSDEFARIAIANPAKHAGVEFEEGALQQIIRHAQGYPYFLQAWGKQVWNTATTSPITVSDVEKASQPTVAALDEGFFSVPFDRLTVAEKRYLRGMAELGPGPHRSGDIAVELGRKVTSLGPTRSQLITKGVIWSPRHGDTAFTAPLFDEFMRRLMVGDGWRN